jgi:hypothetical protein
MSSGWQKFKSAIVVIVLQRTEKSQAAAVIRSGKKQNEWLVLDDRLKSGEKIVSPQDRKCGAGSGKEKKVVFCGREFFFEGASYFSRVKRV